MKLSQGILALAGVLGFWSLGSAMTWGDPIEDIMEKAFKKGGLKSQISSEIDKDAPNWSAVIKKTHDLSQCCSQLGQQSPPKGDKESWKKLTETLAGDVKKMEDSAAKKDQAQAKATLSKINRSCKTCHDAHRE
jgi:cytochrome c556